MRERVVIANGNQHSSRSTAERVVVNLFAGFELEMIEECLPSRRTPFRHDTLRYDEHREERAREEDSSDRGDLLREEVDHRASR